jgi:hypothetical protein
VLRLTSIISIHDKDLQTNSHITRFFKRFDVSDCLKASSIGKIKGFPLLGLFQFLFTLVFTHKNFYRHMDEKNALFGKDLGYRFLNNPNSNWQVFLLKLGH